MLHDGECRHDERCHDAVAEGDEALRPEVDPLVVGVEDDHDDEHDGDQELGRGHHQEPNLGGDDLGRHGWPGLPVIPWNIIRVESGNVGKLSEYGQSCKFGAVCI